MFSFLKDLFASKDYKAGYYDGIEFGKRIASKEFEKMPFKSWQCECRSWNSPTYYDCQGCGKGRKVVTPIQYNKKEYEKHKININHETTG